MTFDDIVTVGRLGRPRGVRGEMFVTPETDFPERFEDIKEILVRTKDDWKMYKVEWSKMISNRPVIKFEAIATPEEAGRLTNRHLGVPKKDLVSLPEDTYFLFDLVGCKVFDEKSGDSLGLLVDVECYPGNDVYVIESESGKQMRIPAVKEFVKDVAVDQKKIVLDASKFLETDS